jgi:hypothetical protein
MSFLGASHHLRYIHRGGRLADVYRHCDFPLFSNLEELEAARGLRFLMQQIPGRMVGNPGDIRLAPD